MNKIFTATEARKYFFKILEIAGKPGSTVTVTLQGHPPVILVSQEEFDGWQETMEIMSDTALMRDIRASKKEKGGIRLEKLEKELRLSR